jgi:hypothetical protein
VRVTSHRSEVLDRNRHALQCTRVAIRNPLLSRMRQLARSVRINEREWIDDLLDLLGPAHKLLKGIHHTDLAIAKCIPETTRT